MLDRMTRNEKKAMEAMWRVESKIYAQARIAKLDLQARASLAKMAIDGYISKETVHTITETR